MNETEPLFREGDYYFNSLTYRSQLLYDNVKEAAISEAAESEKLDHNYDIETFSTVVKYVMADNPDLFYVDFEGLVLNHGRHKSYVTMSYCAQGEELRKMRDDYETALAAALDQVKSNSTRFECELAIHDLLTESCEYASADGEHLNNTAYGALVLGRAYGDGYSYAAKAMLDRLKIDSAIVYGSVNGAEHVWNLVNVDDKYYHLDVMWDDADLSYGENLRFHGYFNLSDNKILLDHSYQYDDILPEADDENDYYSRCGLRAATAAECEEIIYDSLLSAAAEKRGYIELLCEETNDNEILAPYFRNAVNRANETLGDEVFMAAFRVFPASEKSNASTIQIFYTGPASDGSGEEGD